MGRIGKDAGVDVCIRLYEYSTSRIGQPQAIHNICPIDKFIVRYSDDYGMIDRMFLVNYVAWQFSRWVDLPMKIMPTMIFGDKAIGKFRESEDPEIDWEVLRRHGIIHSQVVDIADIEQISLLDRSKFDDMIVSRAEPMRCIMTNIKRGKYCETCKSMESCLIAELD